MTKEQIAEKWRKIVFEDCPDAKGRMIYQELLQSTILSALTEYAESQQKRVVGLFHPGEFVKEEMEARGWGFQDICYKMTMQRADVRAILDKKFTIGTHEAEVLAGVFGSKATEWLGIQATYNAGIALEKMKAAEELAELVISIDEDVSNEICITRSEFDKAVILARKVKPEDGDV